MKTATEVRQTQLRAAQAYYHCSSNEREARERIARFCIRHVQTAQVILKLMKYNQDHPSTEAFRLIDGAVDDIKADHLTTFGIPLEWTPASPDKSQEGV